MTEPNAARYSAPQRYLHWVGFLLVLAAYVLIELREFAERGTELRKMLMQGHVLAGLAVLLLIGPRIWLRLRKGAPPIRPALPAWQAALSTLTHVALYAFLVAQPILGMLTIWANGRGIPIFLTGFEIPSPLAENHELHEYFEDIHGELGEIFYWVIGLHIFAALYHHFGRKDDTLQRMR